MPPRSTLRTLCESAIGENVAHLFLAEPRDLCNLVLVVATAREPPDNLSVLIRRE